MRQQRLHRLAVEGELGKARVLGIAFEQTLAFQKTAHAAGDAPRQSGELGACGGLDPAQRERALGALDIYPVPRGEQQTRNHAGNEQLGHRLVCKLRIHHHGDQWRDDRSEQCARRHHRTRIALAVALFF